MSGSAGLSPSRNRKPEGSTSNGYAPNLRKVCAGLVAGLAVLIADREQICVRDHNLAISTHMRLGTQPLGRSLLRSRTEEYFAVVQHVYAMRAGHIEVPQQFSALAIKFEQPP